MENLVQYPFSRRQFLAGAAALGATATLSACQSSLIGPTASGVATRYDIATPGGQGMLSLYAKAVRAMQDPAINNPPQPQSWTFQSFIHGVPKNMADPASSSGLMNGSAELQTRIDQIYGFPAAGTPQAAWKAAAAACWGSCPHGSPNFVSWHRWYVYYFERVCAKMADAPHFTLPYWNYGSNTGPAEQLPAMFRDVSSSLFFQARGPGFASAQGSGSRTVEMNKGGYMPFTESTYAPALQALPIFPSDTTYADPGTPAFQAFGFSGRVEVLPHDFVHDNVGGWMGNVPSAAGDPVFYVHHCQIDRLWASWSALIGANYNWGNDAASPSQATWTGQTFRFVNDAGQVVSVQAGPTMNTTTLGYAYDRLASAPGATVKGALAAAGKLKLAVQQSGKVQIGGKDSTVTLKAALGVAAKAVSSSGPMLVLEDVRLLKRPHAPIHVFVNLPKDAPATLDSPYHVGRLNLFRFDADTGRPMNMAAGEHAGHQPAPAVDFRYPLAEALAHAQATGKWKGGALSVTFSTLGAPGGSADNYVEVARIRLEP